MLGQTIELALSWIEREREREIEILLFIEWKVIQKFNRDEEVQRRTYVHPGILHIY